MGSLVGLPAEPPGSRVAPDLAVLRDTDGHALDTGSGLGLLRCGPDEEGLLLHLAQSLHELLLSGQEWHVVHGASLVLNGQAWVFLGPSHVGKSTLALEAWLQGAEVLGDDTFLLHAAEGLVEAVPKPLKVRLASREVPARLAGRLPPAAHALGVAFGDLALLIGRSAPGFVSVGRRYPLGGVCVLARDRGRPGWRIDRVGRLDLTRTVLEQTFVGPERGLAALRPFHGLLERGQAWTLAVGDRATAAAVSAWREKLLECG